MCQEGLSVDRKGIPITLCVAVLPTIHNGSTAVRHHEAIDLVSDGVGWRQMVSDDATWCQMVAGAVRLYSDGVKLCQRLLGGFNWGW